MDRYARRTGRSVNEKLVFRKNRPKSESPQLDPGKGDSARFDGLRVCMLEDLNRCVRPQA